MYDAAATILLNSKQGTKTKVAMELTGFTDVELKSDLHHKRIKRLRDKTFRAGTRTEDLPSSVITVSSTPPQSELTENDGAGLRASTAAGSRANTVVKSQEIRRRRTCK